MIRPLLHQIFQNCPQSHALVLVLLHLSVNFNKLGGFHVLFKELKFIILFLNVKSLFFNLLLQRHNQIRFLLNPLSRLCHWCQICIWTRLLLIHLQMNILGKEVLKWFLLFVHFVLQNLDFGFQFHVFFLVLICLNFEFDCFFIEMLFFLVGAFGSFATFHLVYIDLSLIEISLIRLHRKIPSKNWCQLAIIVSCTLWSVLFFDGLDAL